MCAVHHKWTNALTELGVNEKQYLFVTICFFYWRLKIKVGNIQEECSEGQANYVSSEDIYTTSPSTPKCPTSLVH